MDKKTRAAFCTAVGIAKDLKSREPMREILADKNGDKMLRGYAALGLGLIGQSTPEVAKTIADAMRERSSDELRRQTATALGLLGNPTIAGDGQGRRRDPDRRTQGGEEPEPQGPGRPRARARR